MTGDVDARDHMTGCLVEDDHIETFPIVPTDSIEEDAETIGMGRGAFPSQGVAT